MSRRTLVLTALVVGLSATAWGQQRYELKPKLQVGQCWAETRVSTFEMTSAVKQQQQVVEQNRQRTCETYELEVEIIAVTGGMPTAARVRFGPQCGAEFEQDGQSQKAKFSAAGMTVEARRRPDGSIDVAPPQANTPEVMAVLDDLLDPDPGAYPQSALAVGESWQWDQQTVAGAFGLSKDDKGSVTCTLQRISQRDGRDVAEISLRVTLEKGDAQEGEGQRIATLTESTLEGSGLFDLQAGRLVELKLGGAVVVGGIIYGPDAYGNLTPQADLDGSGRMSVESHARLLRGPSAAGGSGIAVAARPEYAGEYTGTEIKLTLAPTPAGFEGTLGFGGQEFPVRAAAGDSGLEGTFESQGHRFDFAARLSGTTLTFTTGGKSYTLAKKVAPVNPLGGSGPANPLGETKPSNPLGGGEAPYRGASRTAVPMHPVGSSATPSSTPGVSGYTVYRCLDEHGFRDSAGRPLEVFRMLLPEGWRFVGGVTWKIQHQSIHEMSRVDLVNPATLAFKVVSPGERVVIQTYPEIRFADLRGSPAYDMGMFPPGSNYGGFVVGNVMEPAAYITEFVIPQQRGALSNARIVDSRNLTSVARRYEREAQIVNQALQAATAGGASHRAAMVTVEYDLNGQPYREVFVAALMYLQTPGITMWWPQLNISARAPVSEFDDWQPIVATSLNSFEPNLRWIGEYLALQRRAEGVVMDVDAFCRKIDADITRNRAETNAQIHRDMYPRLAPFVDHTGPDGKRYFLETDLQHQMNENGLIRSALELRDEPGWTRMPEYTGP